MKRRIGIFSPFHLFNSSPFYGFGVFGFLFKSFRFGLSTSKELTYTLFLWIIDKWTDKPFLILMSITHKLHY